MKIITIVGARPQFVKAAMVSRAIQQYNSEGKHPFIEEQLLHTGQHYDANMSDIFFQEMGIAQPTWQLNCGNGTHGEMTGQMLIAIEKILMETCPDYVLVFGDTNSTLAGALAAAKLHIPVVHIEAGLRSFNRRMPEEINRVLTDHISTLLCCPTFAAIRHLEQEGIHKGVHHVGDVMYDAALLFADIANSSSTILDRLQLNSKSFHLCTVHRAENTDQPERLGSIVEALKGIGQTDRPVVIPLHPRTRSCLEQYGWMASLEAHPGILLTAPLSFLDMVMLEKHAATILTDSGGVQKEAYFHRTPCITLREETEWVETIKSGWNQVAGYQTEDILFCMNNIPEDREEILEYGSGDAAGAIIRLL
ncbi:UDP-N-acetylglucosamine 2-epimerase (non-hydrolyzing) [Parabacteroides sp. PF5-6]|uniref:non-hydrolyzing UDP-N-acetylglucosamine 2-epimerase n=1 Tax=Parabacteroides sp. PF5-6 TaxID=1742403 RepID=UPI0024066EFA|nr:UDP-N-acetylglucosamine 2-epimerase (non-hydrolyzing) [Parabacteroides sp. PF5-6]MDF9831025.1 UDP-GlcNAc3NAcA epimerase [Parabacteroides sp. PF5-6]